MFGMRRSSANHRVYWSGLRHALPAAQKTSQPSPLTGLSRQSYRIPGTTRSCRCELVLPLQVFASKAARLVGPCQEIFPAGLENFKPHAQCSEFVLDHILFEGHKIPAAADAQGRVAFGLEPVELGANTVAKACLKRRCGAPALG